MWGFIQLSLINYYMLFIVPRETLNKFEISKIIPIVPTSETRNVTKHKKKTMVIYSINRICTEIIMKVV